MRGVDVEFKNVGELPWCRVVSSMPYKQTDAVVIIIRYAFGDIRYLYIVDRLRACFSIDTWCFSFHFS